MARTPVEAQKRTENVETHARSMCAMHDVTGAPTLVMPDAKWQRMPVNLTNPVDVAAGQPAVYRARPNYDLPADHAANATSAAVNLHRMKTTRHNDFSFASSALTTALLASIGEVNEVDNQRTCLSLGLFVCPQQTLHVPLGAVVSLKAFL